jgi:hypothetical protein
MEHLIFFFSPAGIGMLIRGPIHGRDFLREEKKGLV